MSRSVRPLVVGAIWILRLLEVGVVRMLLPLKVGVVWILLMLKVGDYRILHGKRRLGGTILQKRAWGRAEKESRLYTAIQDTTKVTK